MIWKSRMVLAAPGPLLTLPPSSFPPEDPSPVLLRPNSIPEWRKELPPPNHTRTSVNKTPVMMLDSPHTSTPISMRGFFPHADGSGHLSDLGFSDAEVSLARPLVGTVLSVSWCLSLGPPSSWFLQSPRKPWVFLRSMDSKSFSALTLSLFIMFVLFILGWWVAVWHAGCCFSALLMTVETRTF
jgi:hypothetical protein